MIVDNKNVKKVERQSASAYVTWDITWILCNACNPTFFDRSGVPHAWGTLDRKNTLFKLIIKFFVKGVIFMFWHDIVHIELLYCLTNFELVWTWNKVAVVENAKKCWLYPIFPYLHFSLKIFTLNISKTRANLKKLCAYSGSVTSIYPKIDLTLRAKFFLLASVMSFAFSACHHLLHNYFSNFFCFLYICIYRTGMFCQTFFPFGF